MKNNTHLGSKDSVAFYRKTVKRPVTDNEFRDIANGFNLFLIEKVIEGEVVKLPERIGTLRVTGKKVTPRINKETGEVEGLSPDWKSTRTLWQQCEDCKERKQIVWQTNEHTDGIRYSFKWSKTGVFISNRDFYSLRMSRSVKNAFKAALASGKEYLCEN